MPHYSRLSNVVIDVPPADHDRELAFWRSASGLALTAIDRYPEYHASELRGQDVGLLIQRLDDGQGRVHVDIHTDDQAAELARLERLGAVRVGHVKDWWVLRDPAGLLFCIVPVPAGSLHDGNAQRWD